MASRNAPSLADMVSQIAGIYSEIATRTAANKENSDANRTAKLDCHARLIVGLAHYHADCDKWTKKNRMVFNETLGAHFKKGMVNKLGDTAAAALGFSTRDKSDKRPVRSVKLPKLDGKEFADIAMNDGVSGVLAYFEKKEIASETDLMALVYPDRGGNRADKLAKAVFDLDADEREAFDKALRDLAKAEKEAAKPRQASKADAAAAAL